jgi:hypothetical protein
MHTNTRSIWYRISSAFLAFIFVFTVTYAPLTAPQPPKAEALFGDFILAAILTQATISAVSDVDQLIVSKVLNAIAWSVAKAAVNSITRSMVNWINSGFKGSPAFVTDLNKNLQQVGDAIADDFLNRLNDTVVDATGFNIRTPFQDQIAQQLRDEYYRATSNLSYNEEFPCTTDLSGNDPYIVNNFLQRTQIPQCNPFGAYQLASKKLFDSINSAQEARKAEIANGRGFLSFRGLCAQKAPAKEGVQLHSTDSCLGYAIKTPGSVIEQQLEHQLGTGVRQLEIADSINEIVGALVGQLVNQVVGGVGGLSGTSESSQGGGSSYVAQTAAESQNPSNSGALANGLLQEFDRIKETTTVFQTAWQAITGAATSAGASCTNNNAAQARIQNVLDDAAVGLSKSAVTLTTLQSLTEREISAMRSTTGVSISVIESVASEYQSLLSSNGVPSATELASAQFQSKDSGTTTPVSLFTEMTNLKKSCGGR